MTYQLLRVEAEIYSAGTEIGGATLVNHSNPRSGVALWISAKGNLNDVADVGRSRIKFHGNAIYMRMTAIGLEYDSICNGTLDFFSTLNSYEELFGEDLVDFVQVVTKHAKGGEGDPAKTAVFIAVIDCDERTGKCKYKGVLPLDGSLDPILVHP